MTIITFLVQLMGATMLLLYAVRMVRTGIERAFGSSFKRVVTQTSNPLSSAATGLALAIVLQSSAAVALLVAGFASTNTIGFAAGLAVVLGADLGSALLIQVLSFKLEWLIPALLALGGGLFIKSTSRPMKQAGRIVLGIAFILLSLRFLRETMDPIRDSDFLPALASYLEGDFITAFIVGAMLAFIMHSSVAVILMCVTLVSIGAIPVLAGVSLVLGANLGSALIPIRLSRGMVASARSIPIANLLVRGPAAFILLIMFNFIPLLGYISSQSDAQTIINVHISLNVILLLMLPFCKYLAKPIAYFVKDATTIEPIEPAYNKSVLDDAKALLPQTAVTCLRRETLRMTQLLEIMATPMMDLLTKFDPQKAQLVVQQDDVVNQALDGVRRYVAELPLEHISSVDQKAARDLMEYAIALENAGDVIVKRLVPRATEKSLKQVTFSTAGYNELLSMHEKLLTNLALASNVLISEDLDSARLLIEEKSEFARVERSSRKKHLARLSNGEKISFESSNIHLEIISSLKDLNSHIAAIAYPILYRGGLLLDTRLKEKLDP